MTTTETDARPRRAALGGFLKSRRGRLSPQDVGLPPGPRRRTPGLRREEVALLAGVGITWYTWLEQGRPINASILWCCVTEPRAREWFLNYDQEVAHLVARLRSGYGRHVGDPSWEEDIRRLLEISPEFAELWARHEVAAPVDRTLRFRHPVAGELTFVGTELTSPAATGLRVSVYTPQDERTREGLARTRLC